MEKITLEGALVKVRRFAAEDWKDVREIAESKESSAFAACDVQWKTDEDSAREMAEYMSTDGDMWAVEAREEGKVVCFVNFNGVDEDGWLDVGHVMNEKYAKRGLENEGLKLLYNYAFESMDIAGIRARWALYDTIKLAPLFSLGMTVTAVNESDWLDGRDGKFMSCELRVTREDFYRVRAEHKTGEFDSLCGLHCTGCSFKESHGCGGCIATCGRPFHGECPVAVCCQEKQLPHCGECRDFPCALMSMYAAGDVAEMGWSRISECERWRAKER